MEHYTFGSRIGDRFLLTQVLFYNPPTARLRHHGPATLLPKDLSAASIADESSPVSKRAGCYFLELERRFVEKIFRCFFPPSGMLQKHFIATKPSHRNGLTDDGANRAGELSPLYHYSNDSNRPLAVAETVNVPTR